MKKNNNGNYTIKNINENVELYGWVAKKRNLGGVIFIDLRDRSGIIQLIINPDNKCYNIAESLKTEYVIRVVGEIKERTNKNANLPTGDIEVNVKELELINTATELPFEISNSSNVSEELRLKYRYLDIRRDPIKDKMIIRHKAAMAIRDYLDKNNFIEVETPILGRSTPEGARDYLVPSRVSKGNFYALPQSPQIFKQLLMVGGMERYFQIAKCFRDEDLRADRQPEFTQVDLEMSFVKEDDIITITEGILADVFKKIKNIDLKLPLMRMKYDDAIDNYGSDKPDLRFDMSINDISDLFKNSDFSIFNDTLNNNGIINCVVAKNCADKFSRKDIEKLTDLVKTYKADNLFFLKFNEEITGNIAKYTSPSLIDQIKTKLGINDNDIMFIVCGAKRTTKISLGALRNRLARILNLIDENEYKMLWVVDFPSFEYSEEDKRYYAMHHPFTAPKDEDVDKLINDKGNCYSKAYDIVINGYELGGGSIRIHDAITQKKMFEALGFTPEEAEQQFGFMMGAFKYGTPPHGGLAFGLDRLIMLLTNTENIKDVIAFPKTASATDLMNECPNIVDQKQLDELGIKLK
ncbi:MAG TPA: aspartate--tRNA ligase [Bacilli bacterium]|nr:aspartate--tRNA ligase [Bacilli bacterium]